MANSIITPEPFYTCAHSHAELALMGEGRWGIKNLTYFIESYPNKPGGITRAKVDEVFARVFGNWSAVCALRFSIATNAESANIRINTGRGRRSGVDGPGGILAWAELAQGQNFRGQRNLMLDGDEDWSDFGDGIELENVGTHEVGHILGQGHTEIPNQLMNATYAKRIRKPQANEIKIAVADYGPPIAVPMPTPTPQLPGSKPYEVKLLAPDGSVWYAKLAPFDPQAPQNLEL